MSRDQILTILLSRGALSLIQTIEDVEAGRVRRVRIDRIPGDPAFTRQVVELLYGLGADVDLVLPSPRSRLRRAG
ncbi:MAG TPA: hypothetical protein VEP50_17635 [bacterium]|nr:hypothetical protein [bacterium]